MKNYVTKERTETRKRRAKFAFRFFLLALAFVVIELSIPLMEDGIEISPSDEASLAIFSAESGLALTAAPLSLSKLYFDLPFTLPEPADSDSPSPEKENVPSVSDEDIDSSDDENISPPGSLFYIPDTTPSADEDLTVPENNAVSTTITGEKSNLYFSDEGIYYKNNTGYDIDVGTLLSEPLSFSSEKGAQVLIIHTHGSESYAMEAGSVYEESDPSRTTDKNYNMIHVGDVLTKILEARGVSVIHDREMYDYPNYNGAYNRAYESIQKHLEDNPGIQVVIDLHRDALEAEDGTVYKTVAEIEGETCSQIMLIVGSDWSGLTHPGWMENLNFGFKLQKAMSDKYPTLARPLKISQYRYNQQATPGSLIVEVGCNGNTLSEAVLAVEYFGDCLAGVLGR